MTVSAMAASPEPPPIHQPRPSPSPQPPQPPSITLPGTKAIVPPTDPILALKLGNISKLSSGGPQALSELWTVFSKCSSSLQDGRRLENLSWRLWYEDLKKPAAFTPLSDPEDETESEGEDELSDIGSDTLDTRARPLQTGHTLDDSSCSVPSSLTTTTPIPPSSAMPSSDDAKQHYPSHSDENVCIQGKVGMDQDSDNLASIEGGSEQCALLSKTPNDTRLDATSQTSSATQTHSIALSPNHPKANSPSKPSLLLQPQPSPSHRRSSFPPLRDTNPSPPKPRRPSHSVTRTHERHQSTSSGGRQSKASLLTIKEGIGERVRTESTLTPFSLQMIIGTVLPLDFKSNPLPASLSLSTSPRSLRGANVVESSTASGTSTGPSPKTSSSTSTSPGSSAGQDSETSTRRGPMASTLTINVHSANSSTLPQATTPSTESQVEAKTLPVTPTTAVFSPLSTETTPSSTLSPPPVVTSPTISTNPGTGAMSPMALKPTRPALVKKGSSGGSTSSKGGSGGLQRTQSSKSVRILEHPTNEDEPPSPISPISASGSVKAGRGVGPSVPVPPSNFRRVSSGSRLRNAHHYVGHAHGHHTVMGTRHSSLNNSHRSMSATNINRIGSLNNPTTTPILASTSMTSNAPQPVNIRRNESTSSTFSQPRSVSRGFEVPPHLQQPPAPATVSSQAPSTSTTPAGVSFGTANVPHPPPPSPASPTLFVPSSVILPRQPNPSPSDPRFLTKSSIRRPVSPPYSEASASAGSGPLPGVSSLTLTNNATSLLSPPPTGQEQSRVPAQVQGQPQAQISQLPSRPNITTNVAAAMPVAAPIPATAQTTGNAKKNKMFFFSSPQTDSDEDAFGASVGRRSVTSPISAAAAPGPALQAAAVPSAASRTGGAADRLPPNAVVEESVATQRQGASDEDGEDEDYDDEDDSEWSSELSESEDEDARETARRAAVEEEERRQREMFAKRVPSQVKLALADSSGRGGGLLSQLLHPEDYPRNFQNLPSNLRNNKSAVELQRARPSDTALMGLGMTSGPGAPAGPSGNKDARTLVVTGLQASKSAVALPNLNNGSRLATIASKNRLTRLGGVPSGVELESDDSDEEDQHYSGHPSAGGSGSGSTGSSVVNGTGKTSSRPGQTKKSSKERSSPQHDRLANLMHKRTNSATLLKTASSSAIAAPVVSPEPIQVAIPQTTIVPPGVGQAYTPRTTRRTMLATELTESLRMNLIWERQSRMANNGKGAIAGLGGMVAAVGNRLAGRSGSQQPEPQVQESRPKMHRGSSMFQDTKPAEPNNNGTNKSDGNYTMPARPPTNPSGNLRSSSDPAANQDYYSPGFHHVGW